MPDPEDPDLPQQPAPPEYEPGRVPEEIPQMPDPGGNPGDGRPRDKVQGAKVVEQ